MSSRTALLATVAAALLLTAAGAPLLAAPNSPMPHMCPTSCDQLANEYVRSDVGPAGTWVLGTTGGDPDTDKDNNSTLLYGYQSGGNSIVGSGYTTIRVSGPYGTFDRVPPRNVGRMATNDEVATVWDGPSQYRVVVTETIRLKHNRFSGRRDAAELCYDALNSDSAPLAVGLRALLDVKIGENDGAPYFVPGIGTVTHESEFAGESVPDFWLAFESPTYDPSQLRTVGVLRGIDVTSPDRFLITNWVDIQWQDWDYQIKPTSPITRDSAVALYWEPTALDPGQSMTACTQYGLASNRGGSAFLTAPVDTTCGDSIPAAVFVNNFEPTPLTGGRAQLHLPPGIALASGESAVQQVGPVAPGSTGSAQWRLDILPGTRGERELRSTVDFDGGRSFEAIAKLQVSCPNVTPSPAPSSTSTPLPTATPTKGPIQPHVCDFIVGRVPSAVISWAIANPQLVSGWGDLSYPGQPPGPFNQPKSWLSIRNIAAPFHSVHNSVIYKAGCP